MTTAERPRLWFRQIVVALSTLMPWALRRRVLNALLGYQIHPTSRIGLAWITPRQLRMDAHSSIGHLSVCKGLDLLALGDHSSIGRANWITGSPLSDSIHYLRDSGRRPSLILGRHAAITHRHILDCTTSITVGEFSIVAGFRSQLLTHSVDISDARQACAPIEIGRYCFVGTGARLLGGSKLPDFSVLGAASLLTVQMDEGYCLYGGVPARFIKRLPQDSRFFVRLEGYID